MIEERKKKIICCCSFGSNPSIELNGNTHRIPACDSTPHYKGPPEGPYKMGFGVDFLWRVLKIS